MQRAAHIVSVLVLAASSVVSIAPALAASNGCDTGGIALSQAYVLADPVYATLFGEELLPFLARNQEHFLPAGDSVRCARALSSAYAQHAMRVFDPELQKIREQKRREIESQGIPIGPVQADASGEYVLISFELLRLAEGMPSAASGNYERLQQPANDFEQAKRMRAERLALMMQLPPFVPILVAIRPTIEQMRWMDQEMIRRAAAAVADPR